MNNSIASYVEDAAENWVMGIKPDPWIEVS